jgi:hypothetical protein
MDEILSAVTEMMLAATPVPEGFSSREIVRRAIAFEGPPRVPYSFISPLQTDFFEAVALDVVRQPPRRGGKGAEFGGVYHDEWGVGPSAGRRRR